MISPHNQRAATDRIHQVPYVGYIPKASHPLAILVDWLLHFRVFVAASPTSFLARVAAAVPAATCRTRLHGSARASCTSWAPSRRFFVTARVAAKKVEPHHHIVSMPMRSTSGERVAQLDLFVLFAFLCENRRRNTVCAQNRYPTAGGLWWRPLWRGEEFAKLSSRVCRDPKAARSSAHSSSNNESQFPVCSEP